ncbi:EAL domain-containing protein [Povalibacter sp.]|uniref:EAL domain-containing protein n=1 Tax=Povalibacter sp. TaxID=1962978 RepID=UPI002F3ED49D
MHSSLRRQLYGALGRDEFKVHYQPKFHLITGELQGVEALLRWCTDSGAWISPSVFIPVLERTGMINEVGAWLFERSAADFAYWHSHGLSAGRIAINISPLQLREPGFLTWVLSIGEAWQAAGAGLDLELTESALLPDGYDVAGAFDALAAANVRVALDDFGTGYSSLSLLTRLPIRYLKIDRSFIAQLGVSRKAYAIVAAIVRLGREIGVEIIAEGIESAGHLEHLRELGCDIGQGYYFSPALSREDLLRRLRLPAEVPEQSRGIVLRGCA